MRRQCDYVSCRRWFTPSGRETRPRKYCSAGCRDKQKNLWKTQRRAMAAAYRPVKVEGDKSPAEIDAIFMAAQKAQRAKRWQPTERAS